MRFAIISVAVAKLGNHTLAQRATEFLKAAGFFCNGDGQNGFALLTQLGALGNVLQAVEVGVSARVNTQQRLAFRPGLLNVFLRPASDSAPMFLPPREHLQNVFDRRAHLIGVHGNDIVDRSRTSENGTRQFAPRPHPRQDTHLV